MFELLNSSALGIMQWFASSTGRWPTVSELSELVSEILWFQKYLDDRRVREIFIAELIAQNEYPRFLVQLENHKKHEKTLGRRKSSSRKASIVTDVLPSPAMLLPIITLGVFFHPATGRS